MLSYCSAGKDSWESVGLQGDQTSQSFFFRGGCNNFIVINNIWLSSLSSALGNKLFPLFILFLIFKKFYYYHYYYFFNFTVLYWFSYINMHPPQVYTCSPTWTPLPPPSPYPPSANQSILKEINPEYSLEGLMLKLKLHYFGPLMRRVISLDKILMLGKIEG